MGVVDTKDPEASGIMNNLAFDDRDGVIWRDGAMVPWRDTTLHVLSHGLHYASCVFEGERVYNGSVFKLTEHSQRLVDSARMLGFELPYTVAEIDEATRAVVAAITTVLLTNAAITLVFPS